MYTRAGVVQAFLNMFEAPTYLEIGVNEGETFHALRAARKVAVDPGFAFPAEAREPGPGTEYHEVSSDAYFDLAGRRGVRFDVVYLDGLHTFDHTLRDLLNAVLLLKDRGVIVVDDVIPNSFDASLPDLDQVFALRRQAQGADVNWAMDGSWMGDVYKIPFFVDAFMQQLSYATVQENHGQTVIWRRARPAGSLSAPSFPGVDRLDFRDTILRRPEFRLRPLAAIVDQVRTAYDLPADRPAGSGARDFAAATLLRRIEVAAKQMPEPKVTSPELMPDLVRGDAARAWRTPRPSKTIALHRLQNVYCALDGLVFDRDLNVFTPTVAQYDAAVVGLAREQVAAAISSHTVLRYDGAAVLCGKIGLSNYGHWLVEMLPIAFLTRPDILFQGWKVFVPNVYDHMGTVIGDSLSLLGIPADSVAQHDGRPAWFQELVVVSGISEHGSYYLPVTADCLQELAAQPPSDGSEKVWISRVGEARRLQHEGELQAILKADGWRILHPGRMTLWEQIAACKGARHVAGVDGAGLTNAGFMATGGQVTSFIPGIMPDLFFWTLAVNRGLHYHEVRCALAEPSSDPAIPWNAPLSIEVEDVLAALRTGSA